MAVLTGSILILHGLVHMWFVTLSQGLVEYRSDRGWTGKSWLQTNILGDNPVDFFREKILILHSLWLTHQLTTQVGLGTGISRMVKKIIDLTDLNQSTTDYKCGEIGQSTNLKDIMGYQDDACATTG